MPRCGSQVILCDLPVRFDTYIGCSHRCQYCFVQKKIDVFNDIRDGESLDILKNFIEHNRTAELRWCDWDIPLHWGGMSDPFQPVERERGKSLEALKLFHKSHYPFVVSTKNALIAEEPYFSLIKECNCVVQFSAACPEYNDIETGASTFEERLEAAKKLSPYVRVNIRVQPYIPQYFESVMKSIDLFHEAGVHGCIFEGIKYVKAVPGTFRLQGDNVYPSALYKKHFKQFKAKLHSLGMKFYCGENRLRGMSDELCCCGIEGMGWKENKANLNHYLYDRENYKFASSQREPKTATPFTCLVQTAGARGMGQESFEDMMNLCTKDKGMIRTLVEDGVIK